MTAFAVGRQSALAPEPFRQYFGARREKALASLIIAAMLTFIAVGRAYADDLPNGLTITPIGQIKEKTADGQCRAGSITEISGPADLVKGIQDSLNTAESHLPEKTITSHEQVNGKLRVTSYQTFPCTVDSGGALVWLTPAFADIAYTAVYIAVTASMMAIGYLQFGVPITDLGLEALAGCLAGGTGLAVNNAINGLSNWKEIVSSTVTGCLTGTALNLTLMKAGYYLINAINWLRGAQAITYAAAIGEIETVGDFVIRTVTETEAQYRVPPPGT
jgi:hypothetical protein